MLSFIDVLVQESVLLLVVWWRYSFIVAPGPDYVIRVIHGKFLTSKNENKQLKKRPRYVETLSSQHFSLI